MLMDEGAYCEWFGNILYDHMIYKISYMLDLDILLNDD